MSKKLLLGSAILYFNVAIWTTGWGYDNPERSMVYIKLHLFSSLGIRNIPMEVAATFWPIYWCLKILQKHPQNELLAIPSTYSV